MENLSHKILSDLKNEINLTLLFFVECDIKAHGFVTEGTKEAFKTQNVSYPSILDTINIKPC